MTKTHGPIRRYLCGGTYVAAGLAMAISGAIGLEPAATLEPCSNCRAAWLSLVLGGAVIRTFPPAKPPRRNRWNPGPGGERPPTRIPRLASFRLKGAVRLSLPHPGRPRLPPSLSPNPPSA